MNGLTVKLFVVAFITFFLTDMIWLGFIAKSWYLDQYKPWLRLTDNQLIPLWWPTLLVYFFFALAVVVFALPLAGQSLSSTLCYGAVLGAVIYGVYDFTCLAIFKDFPIRMGIIDWFWGITLCAWSSFITGFAARYL